MYDISSCSRGNRKSECFALLSVFGLAFMVIIIAILAFGFIDPIQAFADSSNGRISQTVPLTSSSSGGDSGGVFDLSGAIEMAKTLTIWLFPIALLICAWKLIYLGAFAGLAGFDPFHYVVDEGTSSKGVSWGEIVAAMKQNLEGMFKGMFFVVVVFSVFRALLFIATFASSTISSTLG